MRRLKPPQPLSLRGPCYSDSLTVTIVLNESIERLTKRVYTLSLTISHDSKLDSYTASNLTVLSSNVKYPPLWDFKQRWNPFCKVQSTRERKNILNSALSCILWASEECVYLTWSPAPFSLTLACPTYKAREKRLGDEVVYISVAPWCYRLLPNLNIYLTFL